MGVPSFQQHFLSCKCGHEWTDHLPINVAVELWTAAVKLIRCPKCGSGPKKIMFGQTPKEIPVETGKSIESRFAQWSMGPDTGSSSKTIAAIMMGATKPPDVFGWSYPHDPDDLGRCLRLIRLIPEWRERLPIIGGLSPVWDQLVTHWTEIEALMLDEVGLFWEKAKAAPKTYARMRELIDAGRALGGT